MTAFGALIGAPIDGALLGETFPWSRPITLSGVSTILALHGLCLTRVAPLR